MINLNCLAEFDLCYYTIRSSNNRNSRDIKRLTRPFLKNNVSPRNKVVGNLLRVFF